jgi:formylglycine-generating enzyme required for sulfatase activity
MGDAFAEGAADELPLHEVTLADVYLGEAEVTVAQFARFVSETGYRTSAENPVDSVVRDSLMARASDPGATPAMRNALYDEVIRQGGCGLWDPDRQGFDWGDNLDWRTPGFDQAENFPVVCLSWDDAVAYANWVSRSDGLPEAYDLTTGSLLDAKGRPTADITQVKGYRLPTEAEWEFAARERGGAVRFGNGRNIANPDQAAFDASGNEYDYQVPGPVRGSPTSVRSYPPNALGLYDMAGNAWEWVSDYRAPYPDEATSNPHQGSGTGRVTRGGRWGGDAFEMRAATRYSWQSHNRCNASGFRLARSTDAP